MPVDFGIEWFNQALLYQQANMKTNDTGPAISMQPAAITIALITSDSIEERIIRRLLRDTNATLVVFDRVLSAMESFLVQLPALILYSFFLDLPGQSAVTREEMESLRSLDIPVLLIIDDPDWDGDQVALEQYAGFVQRALLVKELLGKIGEMVRL